MKRFITYYGGKARLASWIVKHIPKHLCYIEPFFGSGAVFFKKGRPQVKNQSHYVEIVNDINKDVYNFYKVLSNEEDCQKLLYKIEASLYSRELYYEYKNSEITCPIEKAHLFFCRVNQAKFAKLGGGWNTGYKRNEASVYNNKRKNLLGNFSEFQGVQVENRDALKVIDQYDSPSSFFYLDPPYVDTDQGHYKGYSEKDFLSLCEKIKNIKGSFLLSCYDQTLAEKYGWIKYTKEAMGCIAASTKGKKDTKIECLYYKPSEKPNEKTLKIYKTPAFDIFKG